MELFEKMYLIEINYHYELNKLGKHIILSKNGDLIRRELR